MSKDLSKRWSEFQSTAQKKLEEHGRVGDQWIKDYEKLEEAGAGLIKEIQEEAKKSGKETKEAWKGQLEKARKARKDKQIELEKRLESLKRSEKHLEKAIQELLC